jgi:acrylyl-CoA reductase (NADPH)
VKAIWLEQIDGATHAALKEISESELDDGDTVVDVEWSSLNYKDALAITGKSPVVRKFPMIPGVDLAGTVKTSRSGLWEPGDPVILTGWGHGESLFGGLSEAARVSGDKLVRLPSSMDMRTAMSIGTAGFTAMLCVLALERNGVTADKGEVLVTGAGGGVGGFAVALLAGRGYDVVAMTGRAEEGERLTRLGATAIIDRAEYSGAGRPLAKERWAGAIDTAGSYTLANACASTRYAGTVAACGLAQGMDFPGSVAPFILRGVTLAGIDSVSFPMTGRDLVWQRLSEELSPETMNDLAITVPLEAAIDRAEDLLAGKVSGRLVVTLH